MRDPIAPPLVHPDTRTHLSPDRLVRAALLMLALVVLWIGPGAGVTHAREPAPRADRPRTMAAPQPEDSNEAMEASDREWEEAAQKYYTPTDWDYPFVLKGFDRDILDCLSLESWFEGDKLYLHCVPRHPKETPAAAGRSAKPTPAFDPVAFLNKRYGYPRRYQGVLRAPLEPELQRMRFSEHLDWDLSPTKDPEYVVPAFAQAYEHQGQRRYLLVAGIYNTHNTQRCWYPRPGDKSALPELDPYRYIFFHFAYQHGSWRLVREQKVVHSTGKRRLYQEFAISCTPGNGIMRLLRLPNGYFALLDMQVLLEGRDAPDTDLMVRLFLFDSSGKVVDPIEIKFAGQSYTGSAYFTDQQHSALRILKYRHGLEFIQSSWHKIWRSGTPEPSGAFRPSIVRFEKGKLRCSFRSAWAL